MLIILPPRDAHTRLFFLDGITPERRREILSIQKKEGSGNRYKKGGEEPEIRSLAGHRGSIINITFSRHRRGEVFSKSYMQKKEGGKSVRTLALLPSHSTGVLQQNGTLPQYNNFRAS